MDASEELGGVLLFEKLSLDERKQLSRTAGRLRLAPGGVVFEEGSLGSALYVVEQGRVQVVRSIPGEVSSVLGQFGAGEYFGEYSLFCREARSASIVALTPTTVLQLDADDLFAFLDEHPSGAAHFYRTLIENLIHRLRSDQERISSLLEWGIAAAGLDPHGEPGPEDR